MYLNVTRVMLDLRKILALCRNAKGAEHDKLNFPPFMDQQFRNSTCCQVSYHIKTVFSFDS